MDSPLVDFFLTYQQKLYKKKQVMLDIDVLEHPYLYYIEEGYVRVYSLLPTGIQKIYVFYKAGEIFPITWTFNYINKHLFYEAMSDVILRSVPREEFMSFVKDKPHVLIEIIHRIVDIHNIYIDRVDNLEYINSDTRLIARLLSLGRRFGEKKGNQVTILIPVTQSDIANSIAMTRETVSREMERLKQKKLIAIAGKHIVLQACKKLQEELDKSLETNFV